MSLINLQNIEKVYHNDEVSTTALKGISFKIEKGEFVAITGPSGSGKSTLLHILGLLDKPTAGVYYFNNKRTIDYSEEEIAKLRNRKIGFVFQGFNLLSRTTLLENVKLPFLYSEVPEQDWDKLARQSIEAVKLSSRLDHFPSQLSGGEQQRTAIARALVNNPEIILADEPTGNLDSRSGQEILGLLKDLNYQRGYTVIVVTHNINIAQQANRIIKIRDGRIEDDSFL